MKSHWTLLPALLFTLFAHAQELPELSTIAFRIGPRTRESLPSPAPAMPASTSQDARLVSSEELPAAIERWQHTLDEAQARSGESSTALLEPLLALATLYQNAGDPPAAVAALEQAIHVYRVNSGLHSLDQVDAVESLLATRRANGQHTEAATVEKYLQELAARNPDDARVAGVITRLADAELAAAEALLDVPPPPHIEYVTNGTGPQLPTVRGPALKSLLAARRHYSEALVASTKEGTQSVGDLLAVEDRLIGTLYFELEHPRLRYYEDGFLQLSPLPGLGARMLATKVENRVRLQQPTTEIAQAMIELGDWYLLFAQNGAALDEYRAAHELMVANHVPQAVIDAIMSPDIPPLLPVRQSAPGARTHSGHIDATVGVGPYGNVRDVEILASSPDTPRILVRRLQQFLERSRFRPRFVADVPARSDRFTARFHYAY